MKKLSLIFIVCIMQSMAFASKTCTIEIDNRPVLFRLTINTEDNQAKNASSEMIIKINENKTQTSKISNLSEYHFETNKNTIRISALFLGIDGTEEVLSIESSRNKLIEKDGKFLDESLKLSLSKDCL